MLAVLSLGVVAMFVVGTSLFPSGLMGTTDWAETGTALYSKNRCSHHNDELARFVKDAIAHDKVRLLRFGT